MTTLKNKIVKNFMTGILACILVFSILVSFLIARVSQTYIQETKYIKPEKIKNEFQYIMAENNSQLLTKRLMEYSKDENVNIELYDKSNNPVLKVEGRDKDDDENSITKNFRLVSDDSNEYIGQLKVTYEKQNSAIADMKVNFTRSVIMAIAISVVIGLIISWILSTNITKPIKSISDATIKIKDGDYDIELDESLIEELENLQENIKYLSINLKNQEEVRKQYAQDISHELRTPITNLQLYLEAIKDDVVEADDETLTSLLEEVMRLRGLVTNLNKTFQDNSEYLKVHKENFNLSNHLRSISKVFLARASAVNINISEDIKDDVMIFSDKEKISQIIQNLLTNAIKAIGHDGNIEIRLSDSKEQIKIDIIDDGVGISKYRLPYIFERFYRIDDARNTKENGHGLGLSITKNFVEALGGKLKVKSKLNEGSTFSIIFSR